MAITTLPSLKNRLRPNVVMFKKSPSGSQGAAAELLHSLFYASGTPAAASAPSPGMAGEALTSYAGQIPFKNIESPNGGNTYLARSMIDNADSDNNSNCTLLLCDRLWHNSGINLASTSPQSVNSVTWPERDRDGSTNGEGVMIGLEASTVLGGGTTVDLTLDYTNSAGTSGRSSVTAVARPASAGLDEGIFSPLVLQEGDTGVRSIQNITFAATTGSGVAHLVAYRILAIVFTTASNEAHYDNASRRVDFDALQLGLPRLYPNTVPFLMSLVNATQDSDFFGELTYAQG